MDIARLMTGDMIADVDEITKGWSTDKKYCIQLENGQKLLLRMSPISEFSRKVQEFDQMKELFLKGLPVPEPLDIKGVEDEVYALFTWMEGQDLEEVLPLLDENIQYQLGVESGRMLKSMHQLKAPDGMEKWGQSFHRKIDRNIGNYSASPLKYEKGELFLKVVQDKRHLIQNRPLTYQHGDYHTGNMILSADQELRIIDFNRWDYGDPWEEFNRIDFTAQVSGLFATGQLNGYFSGQPPHAFFELLQLYISVNALNALPWAQNYSEDEVHTMRNKAALILRWYDDMQTVIPSWYDQSAIEEY